MEYSAGHFAEDTEDRPEALRRSNGARSLVLTRLATAISLQEDDAIRRTAFAGCVEMEMADPS